MGINAALEQTRILVQAAAAACEDKKGLDTRILELDPVDSGLADFFLITSALNDRQSVAIADEIEYRLKHDHGQMVRSVEGRRLGEWILLDYVDFVVHVFLAERRAFYDIERLRKSARPLTPAEFDAELTSDLTKKTEAARKKSAAKTKSVKKPVVDKAPVAAKKTVSKPAPVKKAISKPAPAKKTVPAPKKAVKSVVKKAVKTAVKTAVKKAAPAKKSAPKKAVAPARKPPARKLVVPAKKAAKKVIQKAVKKIVKKPIKKAAKKSKK